MSEILDVVKAITSPCEKLIEAVSNAIGKAYAPRHAKKMADDKAYEIAIIGQSMRENIDVPINYNAGALAMNTEDFEEFIKRTQRRMAFQEMMKQKNLEAVVDDAYALLEDEDGPVSNEPLDNDWINRFFNTVQDVSNEEMQILWAKVLAGEVKKPGSFSMRTLETIHNISKDEAAVFQKLCGYLINISGSVFIPSQTDFLKDNAIQFSDIMLMGECGLINSAPMLSIEKPILARETGITVMNGIILTASSKSGEEQKIEIGHFPLTTAGKELWSIIGDLAPREVFLSFAKALKNENRRFNVFAHSIISEEDGLIHHEQADLLA